MATARNLTMIPDVENAAHGKSLRAHTPRSSHGEWVAPLDRKDPVALITSQNATRMQWLVPIRHWRMSRSPFAFFRGAANVMAQDLADTATTGIETQICGDAHLSNFGAYGSPDRELVFDLNDFDETLPGPWEWDLKRLATSFAIAARHNEYDSADEAPLAAMAARSYRKAMRQFADMRYLDVWYARLTVEDIYEVFADQLRKKERKSVKKFYRKAMGRDSLQAFEKLAEQVDGRYQIASQPPLRVPLRDWPVGSDAEQVEADIGESFDEYVRTVPDHLQVLLRRFRRVDVAMKVVGVGSVGTRCMIVLLQGRDAEDPLFLQGKEASRSVLEDHQSDSVYENHGQRVVVGQRLMQAASDSFLGWTTGSISGGPLLLAATERHEGVPRRRVGIAGEHVSPSADLRLGSRTSPRPIRQISRDCGIPGQRQGLRPGHGSLRSCIRRPERARLLSLYIGNPSRCDRGPRIVATWVVRGC